MVEVSDEAFSDLISQAMDELPQQYIERLDNVAVVYEDKPTDVQRASLKLRCNETLFGLYEGVPLTTRGAGYNLVLPDKITLFKEPITSAVQTMDELKRHIKHTLWHEIAHYYGLDHNRIHALERKHL